MPGNGDEHPPHDAAGRRLAALESVQRCFADVLAAGRGQRDTVAALAGLVGHACALLDRSGRPLAVVSPGARAKTGGEPGPAGGGDEGALPDGPRAGRAVVVAGERAGEVVVFADEAALDDVGRLALDQAAVALAVQQAQVGAVLAAHERFAATTLEELVSGTPGGVAAAVERATSFGWDLQRPRAVLLASIDPSPDGPGPPGALAAVAAAARATLGREAIVWTRGQAVAALVAPDTAAPVERRGIALALQHELDARLRSATVSIGVGRRVEHPAELARSLTEATRAVDVGRWAKGRHVTEVFDELGLERLLAATPEDELAAFVHEAIGALIEHDRQRGGALVATLSAWLETRNMAEAARRVHVHYNTLKNRLERIEAIVGPVLSDPAKALECEVAIHVARNHDGPWGDVGRSL